MNFALGKASQFHLVGVHPALVSVTYRAIEITAQDFIVETGLRSDEEQLCCFLKHTTKKNGIPVGLVNKDGIVGNGKGPHQKRSDGYGRAVDLVPWVDGASAWVQKSRGRITDEEIWNRIYLIAAAMQQAAIEKAVKVKWGAVWDRTLNEMQPGAARLAFEVQEYKKRHAGDDFLDGPHYEVVA